MSYCRPAGMSDEEDEDDEFEFSSDFNYNDNYKSQTYLTQKTVSDEDKFYSALKDRDINTLKDMLANGFNANQPLVGGWPPIMHACSLGLFPVLKFLIEAKASVNVSKELFTPLMALCKSSSQEDELLECLNVLLQHDVNINATDRNACTALMYACSSGHTELVRALVDSKCDVNIQDVEGWSALFHAISEGWEPIIHILLEGKARTDLIDRRRRSAMDVAIQKGYDDIARLVCSKKEKRRLLLEEEIPAMPEEKIKDPIEELLAQLPKKNAKTISGYSNDVSKLLWAIGLGHFSKRFAANNVQLNEFLLITDERLKEIGVRFSVHRQLILNSLRKFHLHHWNKASLGLKPRNQQMTVADSVKLMCNITKHLHILSATLNYARIHHTAPIRPDVFKMCESASHQLNLINGELNAIYSFASSLKHKERLEPVDLIKPKKHSWDFPFSIFAATLFIGFVIWKKRYLINFEVIFNQ